MSCPCLHCPFLQLVLTTVTKTTVLTLIPGTYTDTDTGPGTDTDRYQALTMTPSWHQWHQAPSRSFSTDMAKTPAIDTDKNKKYWHTHRHCHCHTPCGYTRHWQRHQVLSLPLKRPIIMIICLELGDVTLMTRTSWFVMSLPSHCLELTLTRIVFSSLLDLCIFGFFTHLMNIGGYLCTLLFSRYFDTWPGLPPLFVFCVSYTPPHPHPAFLYDD